MKIDPKTTGKLNSPYGYMTISVRLGDTRVVREFMNGHPVVNGKLTDCDVMHDVPAHWVNTDSANN